jgi:Fe-S-cluster containining protein
LGFISVNEQTKTMVDCERCKEDHKCCKKFGVTLSADEVSSNFFQKKLVSLTENGLLIGYVFILLRRENGSCIYFNEETKKCEIYENRPQTCKNYLCINDLR